MSDEFAWMDASVLAERIDSGELGAHEVIEAALAQIGAMNSQLNAVAVTDSFMESGQQQGRLGGVPMLIDDLTQTVGMPCSHGSRLWEGNIPIRDDYLVMRFRHAGAAIVVKSNVSELAIALTTEPQYLGACTNPWDTTRSPGGAAAAVASGMVPLAQATDSLGGLGINAASCGLVGLKPTRARTPLGPDDLAEWPGLTAAHMVTRSVRDTALCLDCA